MFYTVRMWKKPGFFPRHNPFCNDPRNRPISSLHLRFERERFYAQTNSTKMDRDSLVFLAKLAEQAER